MKYIELYLISILFVFQSCNFGATGGWKNENIDPDVKEEISKLNNKLFQAIKSNNPSLIREIMSDSLIKKSGKKLDSLITIINSYYKSESYKVLDEYYIKNLTENHQNSIPSGRSKENDYSINYISMNKKTYVSLLLPKDIENEFMILIIYGKYQDNWKINVLNFGQYSILKKTSVDYYNLAKKSYAKSYLTDAINYMSLASICSRPGNEYFIYLKDKEMESFYEKLRKEADSKYKFPLLLDKINSKPEVIFIRPQPIDDGIAPVVGYLTKIELSDTLALKVENNKIKKIINEVFTGIDKDKKCVFYQAFNEMPEKNVEVYGFVDELKK